MAWPDYRQGTNVIAGAMILNGITCGMVYRPLRPAVDRTISVTAGRGGGGPAARQRGSAVGFTEETARRRTTSGGSLDGSGSVSRGDERVMRAQVTDSLPNSLRVIREHGSEHDRHQNQVGRISCCLYLL